MDEANKKDKLRKLNVSPPSPARSDRSSTDFNSHCFLLKPVLKPSAFTSYNGHVKLHQGSIEAPGSTTRIDCRCLYPCLVALNRRKKRRATLMVFCTVTMHQMVVM